MRGWSIVPKTSESIWRYPIFAFSGYHLDQNRSAINYDCRPSTEPFLHQKQIGLCKVMRFPHSPHTHTLPPAFQPPLPSPSAPLLPRLPPHPAPSHLPPPHPP